MKTIEENESPLERLARYTFEKGYIQGATDQRAIDIDKACEWLKGWFVDSKYYTPQEAIDSIRKYMED